MPLVSYHFPVIRPHDIYDLTLDWWRVYLANARAIVEETKKAKSRR